jgi:hypothetical protein
MRATFLLNAPNDISLGMVLSKTCPVPLRIVVTNFRADNEYNWPKAKKLTPRVTDADIKFIQSHFADKVTICNSANNMKSLVNDADVCLSRGREFFIFKPICKKNVALSLNRCYFNRLLDVLPHYDDLKIYLSSERWIDKSLCGEFMMGGNDYDRVETYRNKFRFADIMHHNYDHLCKQGKEAIKKRLGVPLESKVAFLSFRMAQKSFSIYESADQFIETARQEVSKLKDQGYYIISRRRLGKHDMAYYRANRSPDVYGFGAVKDMIDIEMNGSEGFPGQIWESLYVSDFMLLMDISGICQNEAALCRTPIYMPYENINNVDELNPAIRDMINRGLILNDRDEINLVEYKKVMDEFVSDWYNTDIERFWKEALYE